MSQEQQQSLEQSSPSRKQKMSWDCTGWKKVKGKDHEGNECDVWVQKRAKVWTEKSKKAFEKCREQRMLKMKARKESS